MIDFCNYDYSRDHGDLSVLEKKIFLGWTDRDNNDVRGMFFMIMCVFPTLPLQTPGGNQLFSAHLGILCIDFGVWPFIPDFFSSRLTIS